MVPRGEDMRWFALLEQSSNVWFILKRASLSSLRLCGVLSASAYRCSRWRSAVQP